MGAHDRQVELAGEPLGVDLGDRAGVHRARVGDDHLDVAQLLGDLLGERGDRVAVGEVEGYGDRLAAVGADLLGELLEALDAPGADGDGVPLGRERERGRGADAGAGAGHDRRASRGLLVLGHLSAPPRSSAPRRSRGR
jgi:hypothetical protein